MNPNPTPWRVVASVGFTAILDASDVMILSFHGSAGRDKAERIVRAVNAVARIKEARAGNAEAASGVERGTVMKDNEWYVANDSPVWYRPRRMVYFVTREDFIGQREDFKDKLGRLRTWRTREDAQKKATQLNSLP